MPVDVSIRFPAADARALFAQIERAQRELGRSLGQSVRFAAWTVARSLGARTKVSAKTREIKVVAEGRGVAKARGTKLFEIKTARKGGRTFQRRFTGVREAKQSPYVRIGRRGLAKASWMWGIRKLGSSSGTGGNMTPAAKRLAQRYVEVQQQLRTDDPMVKITNRLDYIHAALQGGPGDVNDAIGAGAQQMERIIDANIRKKMGAK